MWKTKTDRISEVDAEMFAADVAKQHNKRQKICNFSDSKKNRKWQNALKKPSKD